MEGERTVRGYVEMLTGQSRQWGDWELFGQTRRPRADRFEFRQSRPICMLAALVLVLLALDAWFVGIFSPFENVKRGFLLLAAALVVFPAGRGTIIDGTTRSVTVWQGWVYRPLLRRARPFSDFTAVEISKKLGPKPGEAGVGRMVDYPLLLVMKNGKRHLTLRCLWVKGARALAEEIGSVMEIPVDDLWPDVEDYVG